MEHQTIYDDPDVIRDLAARYPDLDPNGFKTTQIIDNAGKPLGPVAWIHSDVTFIPAKE